MSGAGNEGLLAPSFGQRILAHIAEQDSEIESRRIVFHTDLDPRVVFLAREGGPRGTGQEAVDARETALRSLLRFVLSTVPDDCEVYCSIARPAAAVATLGEGVLTLRWQVAGDRRGGPDVGVVALRPRLGDAQAQIVGQPARGLREDFQAAGWRLSLEAIRGGEEIWARAEVC